MEKNTDKFLNAGPARFNQTQLTFFLSYRDQPEIILNFCIKFSCHSFQEANNQRANKTVTLCRLVCVFIFSHSTKRRDSNLGAYHRYSLAKKLP